MSTPDPTKTDPILADMKKCPPYPGRSAFGYGFSRLPYSKDTYCGKQTGGDGVLNAFFKVVGAAETVGYAVDRVAFTSIANHLNAYRWYLLEYMRLCGIKSNPCVSHDYILTTALRTMGKLFRGQKAVGELKDPMLDAIQKARPDFPPYQYYYDRVQRMGTKKGGTRRRKCRARKTRRRPF